MKFWRDFYLFPDMVFFFDFMLQHVFPILWFFCNNLMWWCGRKRNLMLYTSLWTLMIFYNCKKEGGWRGGLNISYLTSSPRQLHGLKKHLTGSKYPTSSLNFFLADQFDFLSIPFLFFSTENTGIFKHTVFAPELSSNRINKRSQYMKIIGRSQVNCDRKGADSNP